MEMGYDDNIELVEEVATTSHHVPVSPKPVLTKVTIPKTVASHQYVVIQSPDGTQRQVRIASAQPSTSQSSVQLVKSSNGVYLQVPSKANNNNTNTIQTTQIQQKFIQKPKPATPTMGKFILKGGTGNQIILATPPTAKPIASPSVSNVVIRESHAGTSGGVVTKTITMAEAQRLGLITAQNQQYVTLNPTIKKEPGEGTVVKKVVTVPQIRPAGQITTIKTEPVQKTVMMSNQVVKVMPQAGQSTQQMQYIKVVQSPTKIQKLVSPATTTTVVQRPQKVAVYQEPKKITQVIPQFTRAIKAEPKVITLVKSEEDQKSELITIPITNTRSSDIIKQAYRLTEDGDIEQIDDENIIEEEEEDRDQYQEVEYAEEVEEGDKKEYYEETEDVMGSAKKRVCNCTRSQCLKLYCDCFANGEFCSNCNCRDCMNKLDYEDERQLAIQMTLERNPNAFRPKIGKLGNKFDILQHSKGCNCKRSGCLKNYCECFEAKIPCSANCKCLGCKNTDDQYDLPAYAAVNRSMKRASSTDAIEMNPFGVKRGKNDEQDQAGGVLKQPYNFMTADVVDATVQCMMAQAEDCLRLECDMKQTERMILEEFGRCLAEIIDFSIQNAEN